MANFEVSRKIPVNNDVTDQELMEFIKKRLNMVCKYEILEESQNNISIKGRVVERFFTPVTRFTAQVNFKLSNNELRIHAVGSSAASWVFWLLFVIGIFTIIVLVVDFALLISQRKKPENFFSSMLESIDTEYGAVTAG
ncbi:hypothetical protein [Maridesulfovibrio sp.]|uniref:hypothetical protein n=1 Tax=Maridesulfovibrio sp. TaxID=2795000 RepID=UPI0029C9E5C6|nr:hypothetical protein [Maridesulfovibrio sp.]